MVLLESDVAFESRAQFQVLTTEVGLGKVLGNPSVVGLLKHFLSVGRRKTWKIDKSHETYKVQEAPQMTGFTEPLHKVVKV